MKKKFQNNKKNIKTQNIIIKNIKKNKKNIKTSKKAH